MSLAPVVILVSDWNPRAMLRCTVVVEEPPLTKMFVVDAWVEVPERMFKIPSEPIEKIDVPDDDATLNGLTPAPPCTLKV